MRLVQFELTKDHYILGLDDEGNIWRSSYLPKVNGIATKPYWVMYINIKDTKDE